MGPGDGEAYSVGELIFYNEPLERMRALRRPRVNLQRRRMRLGSVIPSYFKQQTIIYNMAKKVITIILILITGLILVTVLYPKVGKQHVAETTTTTIPLPPHVVSSDDVMSGIILARDITESADYSECDNLSGKGLLAAREMCFVKIAYDTRNKTICDRVTDETMRGRCIRVVEEAMKEE